MIHLFIADQGDEYEHIEVPKTTKKLARVAPVTWQRRLNNELVRTPKQFSVGLLEGLKHLPLAYRYHTCVLCSFCERNLSCLMGTVCMQDVGIYQRGAP